MLIALDFDSTLARTDPFVQLAEQNGRSDDVAALLDRIASGEVGFETGIRSAVDHLEGLQDDAVEEALTHVRMNPAAVDMAASFQAADHHVAVFSDAPERAIRSCFAPDKFEADSVVANELSRAEGSLTGTIQGPPLGQTKAESLDTLAAEEGVPLSETLAIGSDRRDLPMLQAAGLGVGIDPTSLVGDECDRSFPSVNRAHEWFGYEGIV